MPTDGQKPGIEQPQSAARQWIDGLVAGLCTEGDFITQILLLEDEDPDVSWEVLAMLDQLHRRDRISKELFLRVKARLQHECLGYGAAGAAVAESTALPKSPRLRVVDPDTEPPAMQPAADAPAVPVTAVSASPAAIPAAPRPPSTSDALAPAAAKSTPAAPSLRVAEHAQARRRPGDVLKGRYRVVDIHRRAETSLLIEAIDEVRDELPDVNQRVALHLISDERSRDVELVQRIYKLQALAHPSIARVFDVDEDDGELFFTMEWIKAVSLQQMLQRNGASGLTLPLARGILSAVAGALFYAHGRNVAHGDVGPANVWVTDNGEVRLQGFVLEGRRLMANAAADRVGFAWLVYELMWRCPSPGSARQPRGHEVLRRPPGVTREDWQVLQLALQGDASAATRLMTSFAVEGGANASSYGLGQAAVKESGRTPSRFGPFAAAASLVAAVGIAAHFLFGDPSEGVRAATNLGMTAAEASPADVEVAGDALALPSGFEMRPVAAQPVLAKGSVPVPVATTIPATVAVEPAAEEVTRDQLDMPRTVVRVADNQPVAKVWVRRRGNLRGPAVFQWWTETGSAQADRDYAAVAPRWEVIAEGSSGIELLVPLVSDPARNHMRSFYVKIGRAGNSVSLGSRTLVQVEIMPSPTGPRPVAAVAAQSSVAVVGVRN